MNGGNASLSNLRILLWHLVDGLIGGGLRLRVHHRLTWLAGLLLVHLLTLLAAGLYGLRHVHNLLSTVRLYIHHLLSWLHLRNRLVHWLAWLSWLLVNHGLVVDGGSGHFIAILLVLAMHGLCDLSLLSPLLLDAADDTDDHNDGDDQAESGKSPPEPNKVIDVGVVVVTGSVDVVS